MQIFKDRQRIAWAGKQIQYSPHQGLARSSFSTKWFEQTKKFSSFGKGTAWWMFCIHLCRNDLLWAFAVGILWKTQSWDIFARVRTAICVESSNRDGSLEESYSVIQVDISHPHITSHILLAKAFKNLRRKNDFESSVSRNKLEKYTFLWFKKRDFYF